MSTTVKVIVVVIIAAVLGGGAFAAIHHSKGSDAAIPSSNTSPSTSASSNSSNNSAPVAATITFTDSGFSPAEVTIQSGQAVRFTNSSSQIIDVDSDPHPAHTDDSELNIGTVEAGSSKTAVLTTKGTWGYHDHLNPGFTGKIHVE